MSKTRSAYDAEFKRNAVLMVEKSGRTATDVAESLGIGVDLIYRWRREMQQNGHIAFPGQGNEIAYSGTTAHQGCLKSSSRMPNLIGIY